MFRVLLMAVALSIAGASNAAAFPPDDPTFTPPPSGGFPREGVPHTWRIREIPLHHRTGAEGRVSRFAQVGHGGPTNWTIPAGKFGLQLADGIRIIGNPTKGWGAPLRTTFGTVTIPLTQIRRLETLQEGVIAIHLKNGDRVSGTLAAKTLRFETQFGTLNIPTSDVRSMASSAARPGTPDFNVVGKWDAVIEFDAGKFRELLKTGSLPPDAAESMKKMLTGFSLQIELKANGTHLLTVKGPGQPTAQARSGKWSAVSRSNSELKLQATVDGDSRGFGTLSLTFRGRDEFAMDSAEPEFRKIPFKTPIRFKRVKR